MEYRKFWKAKNASPLIVSIIRRYVLYIDELLFQYATSKRSTSQEHTVVFWRMSSEFALHTNTAR
jgi:hypothetical protein